jgi:hypothetical protein
MSRTGSGPSKEATKNMPLFYRRRLNASGDMDEIAFGSSIVQALKWLFIFLLGVILAFHGRFDPSILPLLHFILKLLG